MARRDGRPRVPLPAADDGGGRGRASEKTVQRVSPLLEVSKSFKTLLEKGGVTSSYLMDMDFVVECIRGALKRGITYFEDIALRTFRGRINGKKADRLYQRFMRENKLRLAEIVLSSKLERP
jgi:hypothetical protein